LKINTRAVHTLTTAQGAPAVKINSEKQLLRSVMCCMLWEDSFYEDGKTIAERIAELIPQVSPEFAAATAFYARTKMKLRHVPLLLVREMARHPLHKALVSRLLPDVIQRPDELTEFMAIYWKDGKQPLSAQVKKGLAAAFRRFDEYALAKYNRDHAVKLRDVLFLSHSKPTDAPGDKYTKAERKAGVDRVLSSDEKLYQDVINGTLKSPETWEVKLSAGGDKKQTFTELMEAGKLGAMAFVKNLRNMQESGVDKALVTDFAMKVKTDRVLPFRFIAAARHVPMWEDVIEPMMLRCIADQVKLPGKTKLLVDVSGSMDWVLSKQSDMKRTDAAFGLAILLREICEDIEIFTFSNAIANIPPRHGFALRDAMDKSQPHGGTYLGNAVTVMNRADYDRLIVITDEQSADRVPDPKGRKAYMINVASDKNGVGYGKWNHIDGWSEAIIDFIRELERETDEIATAEPVALPTGT
jgi:60 kDa SS-A/Ro ribonucleoprotein